MKQLLAIVALFLMIYFIISVVVQKKEDHQKTKLPHGVYEMKIYRFVAWIMAICGAIFAVPVSLFATELIKDIDLVTTVIFWIFSAFPLFMGLYALNWRIIYSDEGLKHRTSFRRTNVYAYEDIKKAKRFASGLLLILPHRIILFDEMTDWQDFAQVYDKWLRKHGEKTLSEEWKQKQLKKIDKQSRKRNDKGFLSNLHRLQSGKAYFILLLLCTMIFIGYGAYFLIFYLQYDSPKREEAIVEKVVLQESAEYHEIWHLTASDGRVFSVESLQMKYFLLDEFTREVKGGDTLTVWYLPSDAEDKYIEVYQIDAGNKTYLSFEDTVRTHDNDAKLGMYACGPIILFGLLFIGGYIIAVKNIDHRKKLLRLYIRNPVVTGANAYYRGDSIR